MIQDQARSEQASTTKVSEALDGDQVTLGMARKADDPDTARPLDHPEALPGEKPARGDNAEPG